ncbi:MAG: helix-hairpin-helix domain-containing protein [bacterium]|nr:helix-hairpin-helix domain-containing protein [bacterium]
MITKITGLLTEVGDAHATLAIDALEYQVFIAEFARRQLQTQLNSEVTFFTLHYFDGNPAHGRMTPRLVGFLNRAEREFFDLFCSVDGVGSKKALRAMVRPVQEVAVLIEEQDAKGLAALPGIGPATAERIVAKLRRKMPRFALIANAPSEGAEVEQDVVRETFEALMLLGHSESEARTLINDVIDSKKKFKDVDAVIKAIYEQKRPS